MTMTRRLRFLGFTRQINLMEWQGPETIVALQVGYDNEREAHLNYLAYAKKGGSEDYPNIARLFAAFSTAESIHARNFKKVLSDLGVEVDEEPRAEVRVLTTKKNLKKAIDFELADEDQKCPRLIEQAKLEDHKKALRSLTDKFLRWNNIVRKKCEEEATE